MGPLRLSRHDAAMTMTITLTKDTKASHYNSNNFLITVALRVLK